MPDVLNPFAEWLPKVVADPIHVDESEEGLNAEALANLWGFGFSSEELRGVSEEDVEGFVRAVEEARERQILERFGGRPMAFYCWVDEMLGELRLSIVSASHGRLPFGKPPEIVEDLAEIARAYLACAYHDGIPMGEFRTVTQEDIDAYVEPAPYIVRVWASMLPRSLG